MAASILAEAAGLCDADPTDARLVADVEAARDFCQRVRWDLDFDGAVPADCHKAWVLYSSRLFLQRNAQVGMGGYDEYGNPLDLGSSMVEVRRLLGDPRPVVA